MAEKKSLDMKSEMPDSEENVDKIRDILFGAQMRDYEKRFSALEERILKELSALRSDSDARMDELEGYIRSEVDAVSDALSAERKERESGEKDINKDIHSLEKELEQKSGDLADKMMKGQRELREKLLEQSKSLSGDLSRTREELTQTLQQAMSELRSDKTDRKALASLFTEIAIRLNDDEAS